MATSYEDIYNRAVFRFKDYDFLQMADEDVTAVLSAFLHSALSDFEPVCLLDLSDRDDENATFNIDLDNEVSEILALGITYYWISARIADQEMLRNSLSTKDYTFFSPANLLRESQDFRDQVRKEYRDRITQYTYHHGLIGQLSVKNPNPK